MTGRLLAAVVTSAIVLTTTACRSAEDTAPSVASDAPATTASAPTTDTDASTTSAPAPTTTATTTIPTTDTPTADARDDDADEPVPPDELPLPDSVDSMVAALDEAEAAVRTSADTAPWGRRTQQLYGQLGNRAEWHADVVAGVPPDIRSAVANNLGARVALSSLVGGGPVADTLPAWRLRAPLPIDTLLAHYAEAEAATGIGWEYLAAIHLVETRMGRIEGRSTAGAVGPMQFLPSTWAECCVGDPTVDRDAILGAATYLVIRGGPDDMERALRGYNNSAAYVTAVSAYADVLRDDPAAYAGYHAWEVFFLTTAGVIALPIGYDELEPVPVDEWLVDRPDTLVDPTP